MIDIYLTPSEHRRYMDLYVGAGIFKLDPDADAKTKNEQALKALDSVLPGEKMREVIGSDDFNVLRRVSAFTVRWARIGGPR